jgi:hypothetical protein
MPICALSLCLAIFLCYVSASGPRFDHRAEVIRNQFAILEGLPHVVGGEVREFPQFQSRVLFPVLLAGMASLRVLSESEAFILLRLMTAFLAVGAFLLLCVSFEQVSIRTAGLGAGALAYALVFTFNHPWEHPTDFPDVLFLCAFLWCAIRRRPVMMALATAAGTLNHQTAAFAGVIWFFLWGLDGRSSRPWIDRIYSAGLMLGSYALSTGIKRWYGGDASIGYEFNGWMTVPQLFEALANPGPYQWPVLLAAMVTPVALWLWTNKAALSGELAALLKAALCVVVMSSPVAFWSELRSVFLAPMVIVTFVATAAESRTQRALQQAPRSDHVPSL